MINSDEARVIGWQVLVPTEIRKGKDGAFVEKFELENYAHIKNAQFKK